MNKRTNKRTRSFLNTAFLFLFVFLLSFVLIKPAQAMLAPSAIPVVDIPQTYGQTSQNIWTKVTTKLKEYWEKSGSAAFQSLVRNSLNRIAYDAAERIATAGEGQTPLYVQESFSDYAKGIGSAAGGEFISELSKWTGVNWCEPDLGAKVTIGLGLINKARPGDSVSSVNCSGKQMIAAWKTEAEKWKSMSEDPDYLNKMLNAISPTSSDIGISMLGLGKLDDTINEANDKAWEELNIKQGWLDVRNIGGMLEGVPDEAKDSYKNTYSTVYQSMLKTSGNALVDAANVFLNQLAIQGLNRAARELTAITSKPKASSLNDLKQAFQDALDNSRSGQAEVAADLQAKILTPRFDSRGDYDVLNDLTICPDANNPGPTNCVIDDKFREAISEQKTVAEALADGSLNANWPVTASVDYNQGYSYRSLIILRKYRIIPATWEKVLLNEPNFRMTLGDLVSCYSSNDEYNQYSSSFIPGEWCEGYIDPNWVLKIPQQYCKREGYGPVLQYNTIDGIDSDGDGQEDQDSQLQVVRSDTYCADEQSCIKENDDGSCEAFGYCTSERRIWKFDSPSCEAVYNTCQTFTGQDKDKVSYLKNTLEYCTSEEAGCKSYALNGIYNISTGLVAWSNRNLIHLNDQAGTCDAKNEGCHEFVRVKDQYGANLAYNPELSGELIVGPNDYNISGESYTLSFYARGCWGSDTNTKFYISSIDGASKTEGTLKDKTATNNQWTYHSVSHLFPTNKNLGNKIRYFIANESSHCEFTKIKIEKGPVGTDYRDYYDSASLFYQKFLPEYLKDVCYNNPSSVSPDYTLKADAPKICSNYIRRCNADEEGCSIYTSNDNFEIPAKVTTADKCFNDCIGYDVYIQKADYFTSQTRNNFIPETAAACTAEAVGCTEFTNLDDVASGGETKEYYSSLRNCIKPDSGFACEIYYSWEGTEESGYQLRSLSLQKAEDSSEPAVSIDDAQVCNATIYNYAPSHPDYSPECREFYNRDGQISYHLYSLTTTCSESCNRYRMTKANSLLGVTNANDCPIGDYWDNTNSTCYHCLNGGEWDTNLKACIYQAVPGEGKKCSAAESGCHEYNGNRGNNVQIVKAWDFETGIDDWKADSGITISASTESNTRTGHSLKYMIGGGSDNPVGSLIKSALAATDKGMSTDASALASQGGAYVIKFLAKAEKEAVVDVWFSDATNANKSVFNINQNANKTSVVVKAGGEWGVYQVSLDSLDHLVTVGEKLNISSTETLYIDSIILSQITDRFYLIEDSWQTPNQCYYDVLNNYQGVDYNLGCESYTDKNGGAIALRQFSRLCQAESAGCEVMIDTHNISDPEGYKSDDESLVTAPHEYIYAVYDFDKQCSSDDSGCQRLGLPYNYTNYALASDVFLKNNPNNYNKSLCNSEAVGCEAYQADDSVYYFKNPGENICEWRKSSEANSEYWGWYRVKQKYCDGLSTNKACAKASDCTSDQSCILEVKDQECWVDYQKTIGLSGQIVSQPKNFVGLCNTEASGCTEYIDPISTNSANLIMDANLKEIYDGGNGSEAWPNNQQTVKTKLSTLYIFSIKAPSGYKAEIDCKQAPLYKLLADNTFATSSVKILIDSSVEPKAMFLTETDATCIVSITAGTLSNIDNISLKEAIIGYNLSQEVDKTSCNSKVEPEAGCILFNERAADSSGLNTLNISAIKSPNDSGGAATCDPTVAACDANTILKVKPDRICSEWLACQGYVKDDNGNKICYEIGNCDQFNIENNNLSCSHFVTSTNKPEPSDSDYNKKMLPYWSNASGYYLVNKYSLADMKEVGPIVSDIQDNFERSSSDFYNMKGKYEIIDNPTSAKKYGATYPAEGKGFLAISADGQMGTKQITLTRNKDYYLSFMVNTSKLAAGDFAKIEVFGDSENIRSFSAPAASNWQRFTVPIKFGASTSSTIPVTIVLSTTAKSSISYVFFDDISMEPVLKTSINTFANKDCRLYPTEDSVTCSTRYNNVIADGWYGYCLQYDPKNPKTCLLWYPQESIKVDAQKKNAGSSIGKFPIYYCSLADARFDILEKRVPFGVAKINRTNKVFSGCSSAEGICNIILDKDLNQDRSNRNVCGSEKYQAKALKVNDTENGDEKAYYIFCEPKTSVQKNGVEEIKVVKKITFNLDNLNVSDVGEENDNYENIPSNASYPLASYEVWGIYDGSLELKPKKDEDGYLNVKLGMTNEKLNFFASVSDLQAGATYSELQNTAADDNLDPLMVYDSIIMSPNEESLLKFKDYKIRCAELTQVVKDDVYISNKAWLERISTASSSLPTWWDRAGLKENELIYNQQSSDAPFGSAKINSNFNLNDGLVYLKNSGMDKSENYAGVPFACINLDKYFYNGSKAITKTCGSLGYCVNSGVFTGSFCIYTGKDSSSLIDNQCNGGECVKIENLKISGDFSESSNKPRSNYLASVLSPIFLKSYNTYLWNSNDVNSGYVVTNSGYDCSQFSSYNCTSIESCNSGGRGGRFCSISPQIENLKLTDAKSDQAASSGGGFYTISAPGEYELSFDVTVDPEQRPLSKVEVNWGDGSKGSVPIYGESFAIKHYYTSGGATVKKQIIVNVVDNWGLYDCSVDGFSLCTDF